MVTTFSNDIMVFLHINNLVENWKTLVYLRSVDYSRLSIGGLRFYHLPGEGTDERLVRGLNPLSIVGLGLGLGILIY